jgi:ABC-type amino acid transport system permease subunit
LRTGGCTLAAQDDSLFAHYLQQAAFSASLGVRLGFSPVPWGAAVGKAGGERLARALGLALQDLHADGQLLRLARLHQVETTFLEAEETHWNTPVCRAATAITDPRCVNPPHDNQLAPTPFAPQVTRIENWLQDHADLQVTLAMLKTRVALKLFVEGVACSLALVAGAVGATLALGLAFGAGLGADRRWLRWPLRALLVTMQSTPLVLLMVFAGVLSSSLGASSALTALVAAIAVLGLFNGSNAGQAIAEARASLRAEGRDASLQRAVQRARAQVVAFVVNATRGSPAASLIGVPELLAAQTDIASFSSERVTTFTLLLVFYMALVSLVVWLGRRWQADNAPAEPGRA